MALDPVDSLCRLRHVAENEAKRIFAARLAEEEAARRQLGETQARMTREREIATDPLRGDGAVEAYMAWLPNARRQAEAAQAAYEQATANVTLARAALTLAHAAAEAVTTFLQRRAEAAEHDASRQIQNALDEVATRPTATLD